MLQGLIVAKVQSVLLASILSGIPSGYQITLTQVSVYQPDTVGGR